MNKFTLALAKILKKENMPIENMYIYGKNGIGKT
jgi:Cdc6-like AAA superfamily ATPase